jgi:hypothetical protein
MYAYKADPLTGQILPILSDKDNHVIDALRYACEGARRVSSQKPGGTIRLVPTVTPMSR